MMKEEEAHPTNLPPKSKPDEQKPQDEAAEKKPNVTTNVVTRKSSHEIDKAEN